MKRQKMLNNTVSGDANNDKPIRIFKVLLAGKTRSGKTAAFRRYCFDSFIDQHLSTTTFGIDFVAKNVIVQGQKYKAIIWDTGIRKVYLYFTTFRAKYVRRSSESRETLLFERPSFCWSVHQMR